MPLRPFVRAVPWIVVAALVPSSVLPLALANAGVEQAPHVKGSVERGNRVCGSDLDTGVPGLGIDLCHYDFYVEPARDGDPDHAYTVDWIQFALEPQSGYCVADAQGSIGVQDATIIASAPSRRSRPGRNTVELRLASPDRTLGSLRQRFRLARGKTSTEARRSPSGDQLHWRWRGRSRDPIHLVVGVAFAHPITEPRPPTDLDFRLTSTPC